MDDDVDIFDRSLDPVPIGDVAEHLAMRETTGPALEQRHIVAPCDEAGRHLSADETGAAGHEDGE